MKQSIKIIYEKSDISIPIPIPIYQIPSPVRNYKLQNQLFDPSQMSPPNNFISKLNKRIEYYYNLDTKDNNCINT